MLQQIETPHDLPTPQESYGSVRSKRVERRREQAKPKALPYRQTKKSKANITQIPNNPSLPTLPQNPHFSPFQHYSILINHQ